MTETEAPPIWVNRITHYTDEHPEQLAANPNNFRRHPIHQKKIFKGVASEVGIVAPVIQNDRTGFLIDGHMRIEEAMFLGIESIPVAHVDLSQEEEDKVIATLDAISAMAFEDAAQKAELLKGIESNDDDLSEYLARELERQMAEAEEQEGLDQLKERYGEHDPSAFWPVIRIRVPELTRVRFMAYFQSIEADADWKKLDILLDRLNAPFVSPDDVSEVSSD